MKRFAILILAQLILNVPAMADEVRGPIVSVCEGGFRQDSYGRGLNGGFINDDLRPHKLLDEACYELGEAQGRDVKARLSQAPATYDCENDFLSGRSKAIRGEFPQTGGECFVTGFQAGQAALDVGARDGDLRYVNQDCIDTYLVGKADGAARRENHPPTYDQPLQTCYLTGYNDGAAGF